MPESQRSSGLMAHIQKPGTLTDALDRVMLREDPASPIAEPVANQEPQGRESASKVRSIRRPEEQEGIMGELLAIRQERRKKDQITTRVDTFILEALDETVRQNKGLTKEAVFCLMLVRGLKLEVPDGWDPMGR